MNGLRGKKTHFSTHFLWYITGHCARQCWGGIVDSFVPAPPRSIVIMVLSQLALLCAMNCAAEQGGLDFMVEVDTVYSLE